MSLAETIRDHISDHKRGMLTDLVFAIAWVTVVTVLFDTFDGPQTLYYLTMAAGVIAYFGFFWSLEAVRDS